MGLCRCLTSIPAFGPFSIPLALEKLDSALKIAKVDALDLLVRLRKMSSLLNGSWCGAAFAVKLKGLILRVPFIEHFKVAE